MHMIPFFFFFGGGGGGGVVLSTSSNGWGRLSPPSPPVEGFMVQGPENPIFLSVIGIAPCVNEDA